MKTILFRAAAAACVGALFLPGCGGGGSGEVYGTVTVQGKKPASGSVVFVAENGVAASGEIKPDGTYTVEGVPTGKVKAAVSSPDPRPASGDPTGRNVAKMGVSKTAPKAPTNWFPIPAKYADPDQSGLGLNVSSGKNKYDITLD